MTGPQAQKGYVMLKPIGSLDAFYQMLFEETHHAMERQDRKPERQGPKDYVDLPDGTTDASCWQALTLSQKSLIRFCRMRDSNEMIGMITLKATGARFGGAAQSPAQTFAKISEACRIALSATECESP